MDIPNLTAFEWLRVGFAIGAMFYFFDLAVDASRAWWKRCLSAIAAAGFGFGLAIALGVPIGGVVYRPPVQTAVKVIPADTRPDCSWSMREMHRSYENNELAAQKKADACRSIAVSGVVAGVTKMLGSVFVEMETGNAFMEGHLVMIPSSYERVASLNKGQSAVIRCDKVSRGVFGGPSGDGCDVENVGAN